MVRAEFYKKLLKVAIPREFRITYGAEEPDIAITRRGDPDYEAAHADILSIPLDVLPASGYQSNDGGEDAEYLIRLKHPNYRQIVEFANLFAKAVDNYFISEMGQPEPTNDDNGCGDLRAHVNLIYKGTFQVNHVTEIHKYEIVLTSPHPPGGIIGKISVSWSREEDAVLTGRALAVLWFQVAGEH